MAIDIRKWYLKSFDTKTTTITYNDDGTATVQDMDGATMHVELDPNNDHNLIMNGIPADVSRVI